MLAIAFSAFSGVLFVNPSPSYAFVQEDLDRAKSGDKNLRGADLPEARLNRVLANTKTKFPNGFDAKGAGLDFRE